jgi:hypothetical protein
MATRKLFGGDLITKLHLEQHIGDGVVDRSDRPMLVGRDARRYLAAMERKAKKKEKRHG